jgi:hypothetical protein
MDTAEVARRDQVVDMHIPQRAAILRLMLAEQSLELTQARHLGAVETEPARYLGEVAPASTIPEAFAREAPRPSIPRRSIVQRRAEWS